MGNWIDYETDICSIMSCGCDAPFNCSNFVELIIND